MYSMLATFVLLSGAVFRVPGMAVASIAVALYLLVSSSFHDDLALLDLGWEERQRLPMHGDAQSIRLVRLQWLLGMYVFTCYVVREYWYSAQLQGLSMAVVVPLTLGAAIAHLWLGILGITQFAPLIRFRVSRLRSRSMDWLTLGLNLANWYMLFRGVKWFVDELR